MLSSELNKTLPPDPSTTDTFKSRIMNPVGSMLKAVSVAVSAAMKAPLSASVIVATVVGSVSHYWPSLVVAAVLSGIIYLESQDHKLCLREPSSQPLSK